MLSACLVRHAFSHLHLQLAALSAELKPTILTSTLDAFITLARKHGEHCAAESAVVAKHVLHRLDCTASGFLG